MRKRILSLVLSTVMIIGSCFVSNATALEDESIIVNEEAYASESDAEEIETEDEEAVDLDNEWRQLYADYIIKYKDEFGIDPDGYNMEEIAFFDFTGDGIPEMLFWHPLCWRETYTIIDHEVVYMGETESFKEYITPEGHYYSLYYVLGAIIRDVYVSNGKVVFDESGVFDVYRNGKDTVEYKVKGTVTTRAKLVSYLKTLNATLASDDRSIEFNPKSDWRVVEDLERFSLCGYTDAQIRNFFDTLIFGSFTKSVSDVGFLYRINVTNKKYEAAIVGVAETSAQPLCKWVYIDQDNNVGLISDWNSTTTYVSFVPPKPGDYFIIAYAKFPGSSIVSEFYDNFSYHPFIKGTCQMPYAMVAPGESGYLIGIEPEAKSGVDSVELLILDCTSMKWVYSSGKIKTSSDCVWAVWQPQYGYYWTLFRAYDKDGNIIDQICYGFENI